MRLAGDQGQGRVSLHFFVEAAMPQCSIWILKAALLALFSVSVAVNAAGSNGPMSSDPPASAASAGPAASVATGAGELNVPTLFANTCGWCHSGAGRIAGKGPQLMGTTLTDTEIVYRIKNGKTGAMPGFGAAFNDDQLKAIVKYIRDLKPEA
jgi:mono/diheme cytochrome c family protein